MTSPIRTIRHDDVLEIISDNPPVNALGAAVRQGIDAALDTLDGDATLKAAVLRCEGRTFFAGADITEFGKPMEEPNLAVLIERIEGGGKPIVAAIHGTALGGGCEIALGCHYRIAVPSAKIGTPEVNLGLLPGGGGTQRLPRVAGVKLALEMTALGAPISAERARNEGLVDRIAAEGGLSADAVAFAREVAGARPLPRAGEGPAMADPEAVEAFVKANSRRFRGFDAPAANIACVVKATEVSLAEGLAFEREEFKKLMNGPQSAALRHVFFAERQAAKIDDVPEGTSRRQVERVGIVGAGTMGGGIAMNFLGKGLPVTIVETSQEALDRGVGIIRKNYENSAKRGRFTSDQVEKMMGLLSATLDFGALADSDLVIEAVYEDMSLKQEIFGKLDAIVKQGAILATNTSFLDINTIAAHTARPQDVVGMHFFSPANVMRLLEVVRADKTAPDVLATVMALAKRIGKVPVVSGVCHGFIGNRMMISRSEPVMRMLLEGASPEQVDKAFTDLGMAMGPLTTADMAGLDVGWHRDPGKVTTIREALCAAGRFGQKSGGGFYDYDSDRNRSPSSAAAEIIDEFRVKSGVAKRDVTSEEIIERAIYPMINEGAKILAEGIAQRASDIDVVWLTGYGWPTYTGGPMHWAQTIGLAKIVEGLGRHGIEPSPYLREAAKSGKFA